MKLIVEDLGLCEHDVAYQKQQEYVQAVIGGSPSTLLLCEHPAIITCGRMTKDGNIFPPEDELSHRNIELKKVDRGGDVTLHAPGQLVAYFILDLNHCGKDLHAYLHKLEDVGIDLLKRFDIMASRNDLNTGLWVDQKKIMSIGIGVKKWVTYHGLGLNVTNNLSLFSLIRPCGLDVGVTSMQQEGKTSISVENVKSALIDCVCRCFHLELDNKE